MHKPHRYLPVGSLYLSLEHKVFMLLRLLYLNGKPFVPDKKPPIKLIGSLSGSVDLYRLYRVLRLMLAYSARKYGLVKQCAPILELPIRGHVALQLRIGGHKVFNLDNNVVITLLPPELEPDAVEAKLTRVQEVGGYDFAPAFHRGCVEERWYEEAYINGNKSPNLNVGWHITQNFVPLVKAMMLSAPPRMIDLQDYVLGKWQDFSRLETSLPWLNPEQLNAIRNFAEEMTNPLAELPAKTIGLIPSHGDLAAENIMVTENGLTAVDWDTFGFRSALHDLQFVFLMMLEKPRKPEASVVLAKMAEVTEQVRSSVAANSAELAARLFPPTLDEDTHRRLFYLEHTHMIVKELEQTSDGQERQRRLKQLLKHIDIFRKVEAVVACLSLAGSYPTRGLDAAADASQVA